MIGGGGSFIPIGVVGSVSIKSSVGPRLPLLMGLVPESSRIRTTNWLVAVMAHGGSLGYSRHQGVVLMAVKRGARVKVVIQPVPRIDGPGTLWTCSQT